MQSEIFRLDLGQRVKDTVTGFSGVITARCEYLTGCIQYSVTAEKLENGDSRQNWFDEDRLVALKGKINLAVKKNGGPQTTPSKI